MALDCGDVSLSATFVAFCEFLATAQLADTTPVCDFNQFLEITKDDDGVVTQVACVTYSSVLQKMEGLLGEQNVVDSGNTAWLLFSSALVMLMTPGLAFFYAGLSGENNAANVIQMSMVSMALITVQWFCIGYGLAFGIANPIWGDLTWAALSPLGKAPSGGYGLNIPHLLFVAFQGMFAMLTPALISGSVVGRMKFSAYIVFILLWTTFVYDVLAHWVWSLTLTEDEFSLTTLGWLGTLGSIDFAGGGVIHIASGFAGLACALVLGKRADPSQPKPHNVPMVILGTGFLWFGWFGFNAGSAGGADGIASAAFINTHIAAAAAAATWGLIEYIKHKAVTPVGIASGAVAGLVVITPGCGFVTPYAALIFGILGGSFCYSTIHIKNKLGFDDTLDAFGLHGMGGVLGGFLTGLFATTEINFAEGAFYGNGILLGYQIAAILVCASYSFFATLIIMLILKYTMGIRVSESVEAAGLDASYHGGAVYSGETKPAEVSTSMSEVKA